MNALMMITTTRTSILQFIYDNLDRDLWLGGVSVYKTQKITSFSYDNELISLKILDYKAPRGAWQIRFKLHDRGRVIRWFECGCLHNRKTGGLCTHLTAALIYISREKPHVFRNLDTQSPFAVSKISGRRKKSAQSSQNHSQNADLADSAGTMPNPMMDLMNQGSIHHMEFQENKGRIKVHFELRRSVKDHLELSVDESTWMLQNPQYSEWCQKFFQDLSILPLSSYVGWKVVINDTGEVWEARKVVLIKATSPEDTEMLKNCELLQEEEQLEKVVLWKRMRQESLAAEGPVFSVLWDEIKDCCGRDHLYVPGLGYLRSEQRSMSAAWRKNPSRMLYRGKEVDRLIETGFLSLAAHSPTLVERSWLPDATMEVIIERIDILGYDGHWFSMDPQYSLAGKLHSLTELLQVAKDRSRQYIMQDGQLIKVPRMMIDLDFHIDEEKKVLLLDTLALLRWRSLWGALEDLWHGKDELLETLQQRMAFHDSKGEDLSLDHTNLKLRDYQVEGMYWLWWLYKNHLHGLFADDMGLGKTHQTMALLSLVVEREPPMDTRRDHRFLVICPTTVVGHWMEKINQFTPILKPLRYHGLQRQIEPGYLTVVTSYGVLLRDIEHLSKHTWDVVVCDEAHTIKNPKTSTYWSCQRLKARMRLCLSGTPIENRIWELKALYDFLVPGYLGSSTFFKKYYAISEQLDKEQGPKEKEDNKLKENRLKRLIEPLKMRRTKSQVLHDLPDKVEDIRQCEMSDLQKKLYQETLAMQGEPLLRDLKNHKKPVSYMHVFALLQRLKQICNHPSLVTENHWKQERSYKFDLLGELLEESLGSGHKVVVFSQYVKMIDIITAYLAEKGITYVSLVGKSRNREKLVHRFQTDPSVQVFVGSLLAGGVGIDLTAASVVIHYDRWWNASKENQATDRVHRMGQKHSLLVLKLVTLGTIEEKIDAMIHHKQELFDTFLTKDSTTFRQFSREELIDLVTVDAAYDLQNP